MVNVFVPTTPNPTSGFLLFCPREDVIFLKMTVEEAVKLVVSGGIVFPPDRSQPKKPAAAKNSASKRLVAKKRVMKKAAAKKAVIKKIDTKTKQARKQV